MSRRRYLIGVSPGDVYLVPGDLHFPTQDREGVDAMVAWFGARYPGGRYRRGAVLQGDTLDCWGVSRYPKAAARLWAKSRITDEVEAALPFLTRAGALELGATMIIGNHEHRLVKLFDDHPALHGSPGIDFGTLTGLGGVPGLEILDHGARVMLGSKVMIAHGDTDRFPKTPHLVARKYPDHVVLYGHTHQVSSHMTTVYDTRGEAQIRGAFNVGHLCDVAAQDYTDEPGWQPGFATVEFFGDRGGGEPMFRVSQHLVLRDGAGRAVVA